MILMQKQVMYSLKMALGIFLILFGIAGMILPFLPGWWVALIGIELLGWKLVIDWHKPWLEMIRLKRKIKQQEESQS